MEVSTVTLLDIQNTKSMYYFMTQRVFFLRV